MSKANGTEDRVVACLRRFLDSSGRQDERIDPQTNLASGLGLTSDEGIDLVLELCDEFDFDFPADFNPVIHRSGTAGNSVHDLVADVDRHIRRGDDR